VAQRSGDPERVLVVTAHPDDVDFGAAGTVATWTARGATVAYVVATDGETGGFDPAIERGEMHRIRRDEQRAAAAEVGVGDVTFLGFPDGAVEPTLPLRRAVAREIRRVRPDIVVTMSPERDWTRIAGPGHPDHLAVGEATVRAVYPDARNPFAFPELLAEDGLEPHVVPEVWMFAGPNADHTVDVTDTLAAKEAALRRHASQFEDPDATVEAVRRGLRHNAEVAGLGADRYAERFRVVPTA
jgi:LmbE family N-acetylglucosaminyl deacetylase